MSENEHVDRLLAQALYAPVPTLSSGFDRRLAARRRAGQMSPRGRLVLGSYAALALVTSTWTMRQASIEWTLVGAATLIPLFVVGLACRRWLWPRPVSA
jgi:hypothetical protein